MGSLLFTPQKAAGLICYHGKRVQLLTCMYILTIDIPNEASPLTRYSLCFMGLGLPVPYLTTSKNVLKLRVFASASIPQITFHSYDDLLHKDINDYFL